MNIRDKVLKVISEIDNMAVILTTDSDTGKDLSHELIAETKENIINFLFNKEFAVELSYTGADQALLILKFNTPHCTTEINPYCGCYHEIRNFTTLEIELNYHDCYKLYGINYDDVIDNFKSQRKINFLEKKYLNVTDTERQLKYSESPTIVFKTSDNDIVRCPKCNELMIQGITESGKLGYYLWPGMTDILNPYVYEDGDMMQIDKGLIPLHQSQYDVCFMQGGCKKCDHIHLSVFVDICSIQTARESFIINGDIENYDRVEIKEIYIGDTKVGKLKKYINGKYEGIKADYYQCQFGPFFSSVDMRGGQGVSLHFENEEQKSVYNSLKEITKEMIKQVVSKM